MPKENIRKVAEFRIESDTTVAVIRQFAAIDKTPDVQFLPPARTTRVRERSPLSQREREIILAELKAEMGQIDEALLDIERPATPKRGRPPGSNDPGSQPPPAAPAAARIARRLDREVSGEKQASHRRW